MGKLLVLYVFHIYNDRVDKFIKNAIFFDENIDFIVICNNKNIQFNVPNYVKKLSRDNIGFDFGGWSDALLKNDLYKNYDHFIFANSSIIGPFIPSYHKGKWTDIYLDGLQNNIKLFGSTINTLHDPIHKAHIQSYIFSMDKQTLAYLIYCNIFSLTNYAKTFQNAIVDKEILMSRKIIEKGWNIGSLFQYYQGVDFTFKTKKPNQYNITFLGDVYSSTYRPSLWNEHQLVFIKGNRNLNNPSTVKKIQMKLF